MKEPTDTQILNAAKTICDASSDPDHATLSTKNIARELGISDPDQKTRARIAHVIKNNGYRLHSIRSTGALYTPDTPPRTTNKKIIAIDYDGTLVFGGYPDPGTIRPYADTVLNWLHDEGHTIIIWSCRANLNQPHQNYVDIAKNYLKNLHIPFDYFNENAPEKITAYKADTRKIIADIYIDDKNLDTLTGKGIDWMDIWTKLRKVLNK